MHYHRQIITIGMENLASVIRRESIVSKEDVSRRNLIRLSSSLHWHFGAKLCNLLLIERCWNQRCSDGSRSYTIDTNAFAYQLKRKCSNECHNDSLGGSILKQLGVSLVGVH
ncbi:hypothetical protein Prudu_629S000400 [Prunus dulcis]|uniref:Uncharacterized protein n=1 Tax=Prunus dulcis TaxID=3755 RepID=A0A5H2XL75_PRUDU|nr:hypothetical protein L3X38_035544 [Prunus dulcis]BBN68897.1 hypothetical protein Prudu_629S000400 [Prunus dulcis]